MAGLVVGPPPTPYFVVATAAALTATNDSPLVTGSLGHVQSFKDCFWLDKTSTATVDAITVVATSSGTGRWLRCEFPHRTWALRTAWVIDPTAGNDENDGATSPTAIKTHAELVRRIGDLVVLQAVAVTLLGSLPSADPLQANWRTGSASGAVRYTGTRTTVVSGTFTAKTDQDRATQVPGDVTDGAGSLGSHVGKRIRTTGGANSGATAWILKDLGAGKVRVSQWVIPATFPSTSISPAEVTVAVTDPYVVETLSTVAWAMVDGVSPGGIVSASIGFQDLDVGLIRITRLLGAHMYGCSLLALVSGNLSTVACKLGAATAFEGGNINVWAGALVAKLESGVGGYVSIGGDTIMQGPTFLSVVGVIRMDFSTAGGVGCFDSTTIGAIVVESGGVIMSSSATAGVGLVWGTGNTQYGISVRPGGMVVYETNKWTITGTTGDLLIGATAKTWAAVPFVEPANNAMVVLRT